MMRVIVTGAAGFIGSTLVDRLLAEGHRVVGIDDLSTGRLSNLDAALGYEVAGRPRFTLIQNDVQAPDLTDIVAGTNPDVIFHLAAQVNLVASVSDPQFDARSNVLGTINVCEASRRAGVRRIVYAASGGSRYGVPAMVPVLDDTAVAPLSPYAVAKLAGEFYLGAYAGMYGLAPICLALANVYGPRQNSRGEAGVIASFGSALVAGRPMTIYGDGTAARDYVYVDDVVDAFVRAGVAPLDVTGTYNVGTGKQTTVTEVHRMICEACDEWVPPRHVAARVGELHAIALDASKVGEALGWKPAVEVDEGIKRTVRWLRANAEPVSHGRGGLRAS
jgi:UDP-glucose 4-epimerase